MFKWLARLFGRSVPKFRRGKTHVRGHKYDRNHPLAVAIEAYCAEAKTRTFKISKRGRLAARVRETGYSINSLQPYLHHVSKHGAARRKPELKRTFEWVGYSARNHCEVATEPNAGPPLRIVDGVMRAIRSSQDGLTEGRLFAQFPSVPIAELTHTVDWLSGQNRIIKIDGRFYNMTDAERRTSH